MSKGFAFLGAVSAAVASVSLGATSALAQPIVIDGSSTVYPITAAVAEEFKIQENPDADIAVGISGTGGGFRKFCAGETVISDASRPIKDSEAATCAAEGIEYIEIAVAYDAITVVTNPDNDWATDMSVAQLQALWEPGSGIDNWSDIDPSWPNEEIKLYGPGTDSGTFDYFTDEIVGEEGASRDDYSASEDDNVLVIGVQSDEYALGYFGYAYYEENSTTLNAVAVDGVAPDFGSIESGDYSPLSRPIFIYVRVDALADDASGVAEFVEFYLENVTTISAEEGYVPLPGVAYAESLEEVIEYAPFLAE